VCEALVEENAGEVLSREIRIVGEVDAVKRSGRQ